MRVNNRIRVPEVRVVLEDGEQKGIMPTRQAQSLAKEMGLDLVEISPRSHPPVCRIMDYGKFKYEQSKKKKQARKHASTVELKEVKFRPKTELHDMDFKIKHVRRFLEEGNKCRLVITFRGREITHPETGRAVLNKVVEATQDLCNVEVNPSMEGRRMVMILAPRAGVIRKARQANQPKETPRGEQRKGKGKNRSGEKDGEQGAAPDKAEGGKAEGDTGEGDTGKAEAGPDQAGAAKAAAGEGDGGGDSAGTEE